MVLTFKFGEVDAVLAGLNEVPSAQRTAFQARLKNFHRLGFPKGIGSGRGRAAVYGVGELVQMGLAIELTQLGLTPERAIAVLQSDEYPMLMAVMMAAGICVGAPDDSFDYEVGPVDRHPASMFLYFDPSVLSPRADGLDEDLASATFFYGGEGVVRDNLALWTTGATRRISLINVTAMLWWMSRHLPEDQQRPFLVEVNHWADDVIRIGDFELDDWLLGPVRRIMVDQAASFSSNPDRASTAVWAQLSEIIDNAGLDPTARERLLEFPRQAEDAPQPDMVLKLPGQRTLFVDAKTLPLADVPHEAIADRVMQLVERPYATPFTDKTKFTILYVPSDEFYGRAAQEDKRLWEWAFEQNIIITSPATLITLLNEAAEAWEVAERADARSPKYSRGSAADQRELEQSLAAIRSSNLPESAKLAAERVIHDRNHAKIIRDGGMGDGNR